MGKQDSHGLSPLPKFRGSGPPLRATHGSETTSHLPFGATLCIRGVGGHTMVQLAEELKYKPEGCGFDSRWWHWNFSLTLSFRL